MVGRIVQVRARSVVSWLGAVALVGVIAGGAVVRPSATPAHARQLEADGNYRQAAAVWVLLAQHNRGQARATAELNAAVDYEQAGDKAAAWRAVAALGIAALPADRQMVGALTKARLALATQRPKWALAALAAAPQTSDRATRIRWLALAGRAQFAAHEPAAGLRSLIVRGQLLAGNPQALLANNALLWEFLKAGPEWSSVAGLNAVGRGWIALARIWHTAWEQPGQFSSQLAAWRAAYPNHPANQGLIAEMVAEEKARLSYPGQIALLLPLSGPNAVQARVVQAGILAAYYRGQGVQPTLRVYDTDGSPTGARKALARATAAGADFVLGPLTAAGVQGVVSASPRIPELALNYLPANAIPPDRFYQFGLSPEQEARASAEQAIAQGLGRAVVLVPDTDWGARIAAAFTRSLTLLGGRVLATATFRPQSQRFGAALSTAFDLDASLQREQRLSAVLSQPLGFTPHRRQDIQFVFFAATYNTALLIPSQIAYYHGLGLPLYSISNVYRPGAGASNLVGTHFPVMPWFLAQTGAVAATREQLAKLYPQNWVQFAPLYGLGYDAWRLVPLLTHGEQPLAQPVRGVTGVLSMGANRVIQRRADPAHYTNNAMLAPVMATAP